jgi:pilus assembly protein Flp/PilA
MKTFAQNLINDESGATAIEYGLIAALIAVGLVAGVTTLSGALENTFSNVSNTLENPGNAGSGG